MSKLISEVSYNAMIASLIAYENEAILKAQKKAIEWSLTSVNKPDKIGVWTRRNIKVFVEKDNARHFV